MLSVVNTLKNTYNYVLETVNTVQNIDSLILRSTICTEEEIEKFMKDLSYVSKSHWIAYKKKKRSCRNIFRKVWLCHRSSRNRFVTSELRSNCLAKVDVLVKINSEYTRRRDPFLKQNPPLPAVIGISALHNHNLDARDGPFRRLPEKTLQALFSYFEDGFAPPAAHRLINDQVLVDNEPEETIQGPTKRQVQHAFVLWNEKKERGRSMDCNYSVFAVTTLFKDLIFYSGSLPLWGSHKKLSEENLDEDDSSTESGSLENPSYGVTTASPYKTISALEKLAFKRYVRNTRTWRESRQNDIEPVKMAKEKTRVILKKWSLTSKELREFNNNLEKMTKEELWRMKYIYTPMKGPTINGQTIPTTTVEVSSQEDKGCQSIEQPQNQFLQQPPIQILQQPPIQILQQPPIQILQQPQIHSFQTQIQSLQQPSSKPNLSPSALQPMIGVPPTMSNAILPDFRQPHTADSTSQSTPRNYSRSGTSAMKPKVIAPPTTISTPETTLRVTRSGNRAIQPKVSTTLQLPPFSITILKNTNIVSGQSILALSQPFSDPLAGTNTNVNQLNNRTTPDSIRPLTIIKNVNGERSRANNFTAQELSSTPPVKRNPKRKVREETGTTLQPLTFQTAATRNGNAAINHTKLQALPNGKVNQTNLLTQPLVPILLAPMSNANYEISQPIITSVQSLPNGEISQPIVASVESLVFPFTLISNETVQSTTPFPLALIKTESVEPCRSIETAELQTLPIPLAMIKTENIETGQEASCITIPLSAIKSEEPTLVSTENNDESMSQPSNNELHPSHSNCEQPSTVVQENNVVLQMQ